MKQLNYTIYQDTKNKIWNMVLYRAALKTDTELWTYLHPILWDATDVSIMKVSIISSI